MNKQYIKPTDSECHEIFNLIHRKIEQGFDPTSFLYVLKSGAFKIFKNNKKSDSCSSLYEIKKIKNFSIPKETEKTSSFKIILDEF